MTGPDQTPLEDVKLITPRTFHDFRGFFRETFREEEMPARLGRGLRFVQDNESFSRAPGVVRGLHFQKPPRAQAKLVRVSRGRIFDVAVDLRRTSPDFGRWRAYELSAENGCQLFIPEGFAHGFCTLEPDVVVQYKVSDYYVPELDAGLLWNDPVLKIDWPLEGAPTLSEKDAALPRLAELGDVFL